MKVTNIIRSRISRLGQLPYESRVIILWASVAVSTIGVFLLYGLQLRNQLADMNPGIGVASIQQEISASKEWQEDIPSVWSSLQKSVSSVVSDETASPLSSPSASAAPSNQTEAAYGNDETESDSDSGPDASEEPGAAPPPAHPLPVAKPL